SQKARLSRQSPIFAASSLVMMIALNRGTSGSSRRLTRLRAGLGGSARPRDHARRAVSRHQVDQDHLTAICLDDIVADDLSARVVAALDQHRRAHLADQFEWRVLFEYDHQIDRF